jgi:hypothetical protein
VWLEAYRLPKVELRINRRLFTVHGQSGVGAGLEWRDADGMELGDIEM